MRTVRDPRQPRLVDMFDGVISAAGRLRMADGWQATFRHFVLQELPALRLGDHLNASRGRPSSELYSMCGLLLLRHFHDWTVPETLEAVLFRSDVQYALNLEPGFEISQRTIERYLRELQADEGLAQEMMTTVTDRLVATLELRIHHQRLDSTHVVSNMASFGRTRLVAVAVKRFLKALHRHQRTEFEALSEEFRARYDSSDLRLFGQNSTPEDRQRNRQQVAEDLFLMLERFAPNKEISQWVIYQRLQTLFGQQCEIVEEQVQVRKSTGGDVIQNPSDPDATYSGHKGAGYQVQLAETCDPENEQQLILAAIPQTAAESDSHALIPVLEELQSRDHLPETMLADCSYGSDENMQQCTAMGVNLVSPVPGGATYDPQRLGPEHFTQDTQTHKVTACPAGHAPLESSYNAESDRVALTMSLQTCQGCPLRDRCPVIEKKTSMKLYFTMEEFRSRQRRHHQQTAEFRQAYAPRSGIESTNSGLKRRLGLGRLRIRGSPAVRAVLWLKITCWNILRASSTVKVRALNHQKLAAMGFLGLFSRCFSLFRTLWRLKSHSQPCWSELQPQIQSSPQKIRFVTV